MKKILYSLLIMISIVILTGCSSIGSKDAGSVESISMPEQKNITEDKVEVINEKDNIGNVDGTKIITTANIQLETLDYEKATKEIVNITSNLKGYISASNISYNSIIPNNQNARYASYSLKVPRENYNKLIEELKNIGNIVYSTTESMDVSNEYRDTEARVKALQIREDRLMDLLSKAQNLSDIIKLEQELNNVIYEKEMLTGNLNQIDDKVNYTQVNVELSEVDRYNQQIGVRDSFIDKIKNTFKGSINNLLIVLENLLLLIIWILPLLVIFIPIIILIIFIIKKGKIKRKEK